MAEAMANNNANNQRIKEFVVDTWPGGSCIGHQLFTTPSSDAQNTVLAFKPLRRLDLSLNVEDVLYDWSCFRSGLFREALAGATELEHLRISTNMETFERYSMLHYEDVTRLHDILTPLEWPHLKTLELDHFYLELSRLGVSGVMTRPQRRPRRQGNRNLIELALL